MVCLSGILLYYRITCLWFYNKKGHYLYCLRIILFISKAAPWREYTYAWRIFFKKFKFILTPFCYSCYYYKTVLYLSVLKVVGRVLFPFNHFLIFFNQCDSYTLKYSGLPLLSLTGKSPWRVERKYYKEGSGEKCLESVLQEGSEGVFLVFKSRHLF